MSKHTPGPWTFGTMPATPDTNHHIVGGYAGDRAVVIAAVYPLSVDSKGGGDDGRIGDESHANARLIAEAPTLLAALVAAVADWGDDGCDCGDCWTCKAKAAVASATGQ